ncbi:MAG: UDP-N-acetylglucosamine 1-carboxyvinyltransferase [candidate division Zixibacteria bacterium]|nr:UDP-N-acetylglucosamine 1-carboxyvinyltransferase [candidate division Zixibacteria bacterium]
MDKFVITGGKALEGKIKVEGSKNSALPLIAASLLVDHGETVLSNIPALRDIETMIELIRHLGAKVEYDAAAGNLTINAEDLTSDTAPYDLLRQMRGAFVVLGPILARLGHAKVSLPGGCSLGARPVDYHIKGLRAMGAEISVSEGYVIAKKSKGKDSTVYFDRPTHTGTENILFAAALGSGRTIIINAACDPEVADVANYLISAGANIAGAGTPRIEVEAVEKLNPVSYEVAGDRLVAGTYLFAAAATGGKLETTGVNPQELEIVIEKLTEMGCTLETKERSIKISAPARLKATSVVTFPYPGFPTDLQACMAAAMTVADGTSRLRETVFDDRFGHAMEMRRLGAEITISSDEALITGVSELKGTTVMAGDIRAGAGLVIACLAARKQSEIRRVYHIDRGYAHLEDKLRTLGAEIERKSE